MAVTTDLISYWKCDEASGNLLDAHGANNLTDINTVTSAAGKVGTARSFAAASSERFSLASNASLQTGQDFMLGFWVYFDTLSSQGLINKCQSGGSAAYEYFTDIDNGSGNWRVRFTVFRTSPFASWTVTPAVNLSAATWYYVTLWCEIGNKIYACINNGTVYETAITVPEIPEPTNAVFTVGGQPLTPAYLNGRLDEISFWKGSGAIKTAAERAWIYNSGNGRAYEDLDIPAADVVNSRLGLQLGIGL